MNFKKVFDIIIPFFFLVCKLNIRQRKSSESVNSFLLKLNSCVIALIGSNTIMSVWHCSKSSMLKICPKLSP